MRSSVSSAIWPSHRAGRCRSTPPSGKRVLVIGAGPSGLSAAYHLARLGHQVEIHEAGPVAGGMLQFGIPAYRLPRDVVASETGRLEEMGVRFVFNHKVERRAGRTQAGAFDAVYVAIGAQAVGMSTSRPAIRPRCLRR